LTTFIQDIIFVYTQIFKQNMVLIKYHLYSLDSGVKVCRFLLSR